MGISVDGPEDIHDAHRRFRNGRGSHAMAMRGIEALHRNQVPFHCISVITADAMEQPERMYRFYRDNGINDVRFEVAEIEGAVAVAGDRKQFWIERGEIALGINAQN